MTTEELMNYELDHRHAGNAYACVEILDDKWVRIMAKYCTEQRAWLAAVSQLKVFHMSTGLDPDGNPYPAEPKKLTEEELAKLQPIRDGIITGKLKVIGTHIKQQPTAEMV